MTDRPAANVSTRAVIAWVRFCVWRQRVNGDKADRANRKALAWQDRWLAVKRKCREGISP